MYHIRGLATGHSNTMKWPFNRIQNSKYKTYLNNRWKYAEVETVKLIYWNKKSTYFRRKVLYTTDSLLWNGPIFENDFLYKLEHI